MSLTQCYTIKPAYYLDYKKFVAILLPKYSFGCLHRTPLPPLFSSPICSTTTTIQRTDFGNTLILYGRK